ncbi:MAG: PQQ-binding-like beta-propeller repeat protein [Planctomycetaceae bacterium]
MPGWLATVGADDHNWPQFRGPGNRGVSRSTRQPVEWSSTRNVRWKTVIPGRGWSSPIVWNDRVYLTTSVNAGRSEAPRKGLYFGGERPTPPKTAHEWQVICLELDSGRQIWSRTVHRGLPETGLHIKNSYASETPLTDGKAIYAYFGNIGVFCLDLDGHLKWNKRWPARPTRYAWGTAASPVLHQDRLYVVNDNEKESFLVALDAKTGAQIWRTERQEGSNWASPYVWENHLRTEIITPGTGKTRSYDLHGKLLYEFGGMSSITIATPYAGHGLLYVSSGYVLDRRKPLFALRPGGAGEISLAKDQTSNSAIAWCQKSAAPYNPTTLLYGDQVYVLLDRGFLASYQAKSGAQMYGRKRLPQGRAFTASPWACGGSVYCLNEDGVTFVVKSGPEFEIVRTNKLEEDDLCMATPALAGDKLLIRTAARLYCFQTADVSASP